jgi:hypothetical protein
LTLFVLAACRERLAPEDIPTPASIESMATALPLTQNAPPAPYNANVTRFAEINAGLNQLAGGRYTVQLEFDGVYSDTQLAADAQTQANVEFDQVSSARRVVFSTAGSLFGGDGEGVNADYEAARLGPDAFLVRDDVCLSSGGADAATAADLSASALIGGLTTTTPIGRQATINGEPVYAYEVTADTLNFPLVRLGDNGRMTIDSYELWISPAKGAVVRYYVNMSVENAVLFDIPQPVTGQLLVRYDAFDLGTPFNITVPFGC